MEIERKFLVKQMPEGLGNYPHDEIAQGYLASAGTTVRIRRYGDKYYLTIKKKPAANELSDAANVNLEIEEEITEELYQRLLPHVESMTVSKTRYRIPYLSYVAELDRYHGVLEGLATVEIEFPNVEEARLKELPGWFGREVTNDRRYRNSELAKVTRGEDAPPKI